MPDGSITWTTTAVSICTVVCCCTVGGSGPPNSPRSPMNSPSRASAGTAMAVSLSQYWKACTNVIDRMPPATTLVMTIAATSSGPIQTGTPRSVFRASPAP